MCLSVSQELPFQVIQHEITSVDACVTIDGGIAVMVVGRLKVCVCILGQGCQEPHVNSPVSHVRSPTASPDPSPSPPCRQTTTLLMGLSSHFT